MSSDANRCYAPGLVDAVRYFTGRLAQEVNSDGGIGGRKIELDISGPDLETIETVGLEVEQRRAPRVRRHHQGADGAVHGGTAQLAGRQLAPRQRSTHTTQPSWGPRLGPEGSSVPWTPC